MLTSLESCDIIGERPRRRRASSDTIGCRGGGRDIIGCWGRGGCDIIGAMFGRGCDIIGC